MAENREKVEYYKEHLRDLIPYGDPDYDKKLEKWAEDCVKSENDPDLIALCEMHDKCMLDDNLGF